MRMNQPLTSARDFVQQIKGRATALPFYVRIWQHTISVLRFGLRPVSLLESHSLKISSARTVHELQYLRFAASEPNKGRIIVSALGTGIIRHSARMGGQSRVPGVPSRLGIKSLTACAPHIFQTRGL